MTGVLLIRHAAAAHVGRTLAGRAPGLHLDARGRAETDALARMLADAPLAAVYTSPLERARETAVAIARPHGLEPRPAAAFQEVDFGDWTGMSFDALEEREDWRRWNEARSTARPPNGESMAEVTERAVAGLREIEAAHAGGWAAVVSHCDVIRPLLAHFLGFSTDRFYRLEIDTASVSTLELDEWGARILAVNRTLRPPWSRRESEGG